MFRTDNNYAELFNFKSNASELFVVSILSSLALERDRQIWNEKCNKKKLLKIWLDWKD